MDAAGITLSLNSSTISKQLSNAGWWWIWSQTHTDCLGFDMYGNGDDRTIPDMWFIYCPAQCLISAVIKLKYCYVLKKKLHGFHANLRCGYLMTFGYILCRGLCNQTDISHALVIQFGHCSYNHSPYMEDLLYTCKTGHVFYHGWAKSQSMRADFTYNAFSHRLGSCTTMTGADY